MCNHWIIQLTGNTSLNYGNFRFCVELPPQNFNFTNLAVILIRKNPHKKWEETIEVEELINICFRAYMEDVHI